MTAFRRQSFTVIIYYYNLPVNAFPVTGYGLPNIVLINC